VEESHEAYTSNYYKYFHIGKNNKTIFKSTSMQKSPLNIADCSTLIKIDACWYF
jgi:hypothetical protein